MSWINENNALNKTYTFLDFETAMHFMQIASKQISIHNHHPEWSNVYNKLHIRLTTHDCDGVSEKDFKLAEAIEKIITKHF